jgi:hypothetical protein
MPDDFTPTQDGQDTPKPSGQDSGLSQEGIEAMQGTSDQPTPPAAPQPETPQPETPPEHTPKTAVGERGLAELIESGPEKPEKEIFTGSHPEKGG